MVRWLVPLLLTWLAYATVGTASLWLAIPPTYAAPLYPAAGIALACTLVYGPRILPAVFLGAFSVNFAIALWRDALTHDGLLLAALIGAGAAAQAAAGRALTQRLLVSGSTLETAPDLWRFFGAVAPLSCVVSAAVASVALWQAGVVASGDVLRTALTWWMGDLVGVLIATPITLSLIGRPRAAWRARRLNVGLPLALITLLLALAIELVADWEAERRNAGFARDAEAVRDLFAARLTQPIDALLSARSAFVVGWQMTPDALRRLSQPWLTPAGPDEPNSSLWSIGYGMRIAASEITEFERRQQAAGLPDFKSFDVADRHAAPSARGSDGSMHVIVHIEPFSNNARARGLNQMSIPTVREALERSIRSGRPVATAGFRLTHPTSDETAVGVMQALYRGDPADDVERLATVVGNVYVTLRPGIILEQVREASPAYLRVCLRDLDPSAERALLAGPEACLQPLAAKWLVREQPLPFAGRTWQLQVSAAPEQIPNVQRGQTYVFALTGLLSTALLGAMLLVMSGRTRRIEVAVNERTAELRREATERQRAEADLATSERRLRGIFDTAPVAIVYIDSEGRIRDCNPAMRTLTGYAQDELLGRRWAALAADGAAPAPDSHDSTAGTRQLIARDGQRRTVRAQWAVLPARGNDEARLVGVLEDITERERLAEAERGRERAEAANRAKNEFMSRMSHELRTPLNAILGFAQVLRLKPPGLENGDALRHIEKAGWHLLDLIDDVLDLSRIESGALDVAHVPVELAPLVAECFQMAGALPGVAQVTLDNAVPPLPRRAVLADATRLRQVLVNLISNAIKYNRPGGRVQVAVLEQGEMLRLEVSDTGIGMSVEQLARLFEPFNRLGAEGGAVEGTGIGLVITKRLVELMQGTLEVRSLPGRGSTFSVMLARAPAAPAEAASGTAPVAPARPVAAAAPLLYVEDHAANVALMQQVLRLRPTVTLQVAGTGAQALAAVQAQRPAAIVIDIGLSDMDGFALCRALRRQPGLAAIPIVSLTADALAAERAEAAEAGFDAYFTKPLDIPAFLAWIDATLAMSARE